MSTELLKRPPPTIAIGFVCSIYIPVSSKRIKSYNLVEKIGIGGCRMFLALVGDGHGISTAPMRGGCRIWAALVGDGCRFSAALVRDGHSGISAAPVRDGDIISAAPVTMQVRWRK